MLRSNRQCRYRSLHCQIGGPENVEPIDLCGLSNPDAITDESSAVGHRFKEFLTDFLWQLLPRQVPRADLALPPQCRQRAKHPSSNGVARSGGRRAYAALDFNSETF